MEAVEVVKIGLQALGIGITVTLFVKREMNEWKKEIRRAIDENAKEMQRLERNFLNYKVEALEKFVQKSDMDKLYLSIQELKALMLSKRGKEDGKTT